MKKKIELMSPAGSWQALEAAINAGADAVYLGGSQFGARKYASNFANEQLKKAVEYAHLRGVNIYVTVNTLVVDSEMPALFDYVSFLHNINVDALIVQDLGVASVVKKHLPELPIFASTQLTITNSQGVAFAESVGFARSVLARETSLVEMQEICAKAKSDIEVFVHGAICMSYSGQCLMSSLIGARSGNRGECAQPCRLPYTLVDSAGKEYLPEGMGNYLLSPKDFNTIDLLPEMIDAGVSSLKIEGRMKRAEYVAVVTKIYREAIDSYLADKFCVSEEDQRQLKQIFNRGFTTAYLQEKPGRKILSDIRPNNRGVAIGKVVADDKNNDFVEIVLSSPIRVGDELELPVFDGTRVNIQVKELFVDGSAVEQALAGQKVQVACWQKVLVGQDVVRTFDIVLMQEARGYFGEDVENLIGVTALVKAELGKPLYITFIDEDGNQATGETNFIAEKALKHSLSKESIEKQVARLGNTDFYLKDLQLDIEDGLMVPVSEINEARRQAIEKLQFNRLNAFLPMREQVTITVSEKKKIVRQKGQTQLSVHVDSIAKVQVAIANNADVIIFGGETYNHTAIGEDDYFAVSALAKKANKQIYFATPRIIAEKDLANFERSFSNMLEAQPNGILASNLSVASKAGRVNIPIWLDYSLNVFNSWAVDFWQEQGATGIALSQELTLKQIQQISEYSTMPLECLVHGFTEMMVTEYCAIGSLLGNIDEKACSAPCRKNKFFFRDRKDERFPLVTDQFCRMHVLNAKKLSLLDKVEQFKKAGIERLRIDGRYLDGEELAKCIGNYRGAIDGKVVFGTEKEFTRGHYFRGVIDNG